MPLNTKQKEAVEYLEGPLLVLAGPGTGKTQLLSEKVAYILKNTDTSPENILCLTFTESGTLNMRERLKSIISQDALKVNIGTYHAFGSEILTAYKNYSDTYDRKLDSAIDEVIQFKIIKNLQDNLPGTDILRGDSIKDIISTISSAKAANLSATDLAQIAEQNIADSEVISQFASLCLKNVVPNNYSQSLTNAYQPFYEELKKYQDLPPILKTIERSIKSLVADLKTALLEATSSQKITPLSNWKNAYFEKDETGNYCLKDRIANKKLKSLAHIYEQYNDYLKANGLYDFDDMIEEAIKALKNDTGFRLTLSERYQFILLDEFQDTNPSQFEIIKQLTNYENPLIMAVGDDDQAIYEFQGASATSLTNFVNHYGAKTVTLTENYRSTQEILDFSREIIYQINDNTRFGGKILTAHNGNPDSTLISRHEFISSDTEYGFVADTISDLIQNGVHPTNIAVIAPKHKYLLPLLPFFKSRNINIAYEKRDNLLEDTAIHEIITLSKFIYDLANDHTPATNLLEILVYPFWNLPTVNVIQTFNRAHHDKKSAFDYLTNSEDTSIKAITQFIADLVAKSFETPLEIFLDYLIGTVELNGFRSPFIDYYSRKTDYEIFELYENLATLRGKLHKYAADRVLKLQDFIAMIDDYETATMPITSSSPYRDSEAAVQILSAHKAKGLEFEYVFLISADHSAWGKGKGNNNLLSLPKNLIQIRHTGATEGERIRLLYVAMTRAKQHLIITNSLKDFNEKSPERLEYFNEYIDENKHLVSPFLPTKLVNTHYEEQRPPKELENVKNWLQPYLTFSPDMRAIYQDRLTSYRMSATSLTSFIDIAYAGPQEFFKTQVLHAPEGPKSEALVFGDLIHATFEQVTNTHISDDVAIQFFLSELEKQAAEPEVLRTLREKGVLALEQSLRIFGEILRAGKAEVNLSPEKLVIGGVPVTGKIDHICIDEATKTIEIYDFKTSKYRPEKWESHASLYKYTLQLGFYKLLLNHSQAYSKYKVTKAHILFVMPDHDNTVHDKVYEFNDKDEAALLTLMQAVYYQINSLNFLDDPDIFITKNEQKGIKEIKEFIKLLLAKNPQNS